MDRPPAVPQSGLNMDRPPASARVRTKHGPPPLVPQSGLNMDRPRLVPESGLNMDRLPTGVRCCSQAAAEFREDVLFFLTEHDLGPPVAIPACQSLIPSDLRS
ncbi:hypothetical protein WMY93_027624 [Mugilogobius chulae]|uniref:Uncharacterized protein n=1 Tax=Mugilogobius chulae TaxID=88201 RepID=A0AAW0MWX8_9GOBI